MAQRHYRSPNILEFREIHNNDRKCSPFEVHRYVSNVVILVKMSPFKEFHQLSVPNSS